MACIHYFAVVSYTRTKKKGKIKSFFISQLFTDRDKAEKYIQTRLTEEPELRFYIQHVPYLREEKL
jgi:hypothetical protein